MCECRPEGVCAGTKRAPPRPPGARGPRLPAKLVGRGAKGVTGVQCGRGCPQDWASSSAAGPDGSWPEPVHVCDLTRVLSLSSCPHLWMGSRRSLVFTSILARSDGDRNGTFHYFEPFSE